MKMHDGEVDVDGGVVRRLMVAQFPHLAGLPVSAVRSTGTVNAIYRLGDDLCGRLPRMESCVEALDNEWRWLPRLAPHLSLQVPEPVAKGDLRPGTPYLGRSTDGSTAGRTPMGSSTMNVRRPGILRDS